MGDDRKFNKRARTLLEAVEIGNNAGKGRNLNGARELKGRQLGS